MGRPCTRSSLRAGKKRSWKDRRRAELLFQILTEREERNSLAIGSNESFGGWNPLRIHPRLCAVIVGRLTFGGNIIETGTESYRLAATRACAEKQAAPRSPRDDETAPSCGARRVASLQLDLTSASLGSWWGCPATCPVRRLR
ncbi:ATP-binding protein [Streptomyces sp. SID13666]|nr:ATP-binding protein [Streptomyces sp. SID13666]NEA69270.1 ATP-binding protein [Streptomyces sp. SID13588]